MLRLHNTLHHPIARNGNTMTVRNLDRLFKPKSIALIGQDWSDRAPARLVARNLLRGGFAGPVMPVAGSKVKAVEGVLAYPDLAALPLAPDLAVVAGAPEQLPDLISQLGALGTRALVALGGGLPADGGALAQAIRSAARPFMMRVVGPGCLGVMMPDHGLNASLAHIAPLKGDIACITRSAAMATTVLDWATARGIGFSHLISVGDMVDVDFGDMLDYLCADGHTRAILVTLDTISSARKFMSAARAASRLKPVIVLKHGVHHPAVAPSRVSPDAVHDAAFRRAGMLRVGDLDELFAAVETLAHMRPLTGERLAIVTNGAGPAALAVDALLTAGGALASFDADTSAKLARLLPKGFEGGNPIDLGGDADPERFATAMRLAMEAPGTDAVLVLSCPNARSDETAIAKAVAEMVATIRYEKRRNLLTCWLGETAASEARRLSTRAGLPTYPTPGDAVRGFSHMVRFRRYQELLLETPAELPAAMAPDRERAAAIITLVRATGRTRLNEAETAAVLAAYGVQVAATRMAKTPAAVAEAAHELGGTVVLKIDSPDIPFKSDVGGVVLNLTTPEEAQQAAEAMLGRVRTRAPHAHISGFAVQEMIRRPGALELMAGITADPLFGPVILFGQGGIAAEALADIALGLPPLNLPLAEELMSRTHVQKQFRGRRGRPPVDRDAVALVLTRIAQIAADLPEVCNLDVNPLLADELGAVVLDASIQLCDPARMAPPAVPAYPSRLEKILTLRDGTKRLMRPVRPEDSPAFLEMFHRLDPNDIRFRFFAPLKSLPPALVARLTQIDYDREMAFMATPLPGDDDDGMMHGVVRVTADPDNIAGEYAIAVRSDQKGKGLGYQLMQEIIAHGRRRGLQEIDGTILRENEPMIDMVRDLGFKVKADPDDPSVVQVVLTLKDS